MTSVAWCTHPHDAFLDIISHQLASLQTQQWLNPSSPNAENIEHSMCTCKLSVKLILEHINAGMSNMLIPPQAKYFKALYDSYSGCQNVHCICMHIAES